MVMYFNMFGFHSAPGLETVQVCAPDDLPMPKREWYDEYEDYLGSWYVARAIRRDHLLNEDELNAKFEALRDCILPDWHRRAHP